MTYELSATPALRKRISERQGPAMLRFREVMPPVDPAQVVTLGEGSTPLVPARAIAKKLKIGNLWFKDESQNPTRSFKARGMAVAVTMARSFGARSLAVPTAGNAGCALAAYGARAGLPVYIAMPSDTPGSIRTECLSYGAEVEMIDGFITDCAARVRQRVADEGGFDLSTLKEPYRVEGKKLMGYELLFDLNGLPDVILYPTGGGTGLIGMWKAFDEMERLGWIGEERPRMFAVQSTGCAPIVRAFESGLDHASEWAAPQTSAWGLRVPRAIGDRLMLAALRESGGGAVAVAEESIEDSAARIRHHEGIDAGPEAGAALLALDALVESGAIDADESVVVFNTGGNKYSGRD